MSVKPNYKYLDFTRKDRRGTLVLLFIILLICTVPFVYPLVKKETLADKPGIDATLATLQLKKEPAGTEKKYQNYTEEERRPYHFPSSGYASSSPVSKGDLFNFDPNTISAESWKKLGLRDKTIATIMNYRSKGGKFKQPEDIKKIWGLFPDEAERLMPYVNIAAGNEILPPAKEDPASRNYSNNFSETKKYESKKTYAPVNINNSDTTAWIALPGIGSKLSQRIINYREKLGGFYSINQVGETFGLPDSVFQKIKPMLQLDGEVKKININTVTLEELKTHPYVRYQLANIIIQYRNQHGDYNNVEDIKKIMIITEEIFSKISPYLTVE